MNTLFPFSFLFSQISLPISSHQFHTQAKQSIQKERDKEQKESEDVSMWIDTYFSLSETDINNVLKMQTDKDGFVCREVLLLGRHTQANK